VIERTVIALVVILFALAAYRVGTRWQIVRARSLASPSQLPALKPGIPAIVYFWSDTCAPCKMIQAPALRQLEDELGRDKVQVIAIDALRQTEAADAWGVLSVPTTFVLDRSGQARRVNHGVAYAEQLKRQIAMLS
jgi:thiol-disulfide isomerase/thioredoxin